LNTKILQRLSELTTEQEGPAKGNGFGWRFGPALGFVFALSADRGGFQKKSSWGRRRGLRPSGKTVSPMTLKKRLWLRPYRADCSKLKWSDWNGYLAIQPDDGGQDVFVHISAVEKAGHSTLAEGARVSYELQPGKSGKMSAENLRVGWS